MPHFCPRCHADEYVCQVCGKVRCSRECPSKWMKPVPGKQFEGNVCPDCQPMDMKQVKDGVAKMFFGTTLTEAYEKKICVRCGKPAGLFRDLPSVKEYKMSGFCQACQDVIFK